MPRKTMFPRLRRKGAAYYYDTQQTPRKWIPLGSNRQRALQEWERLAAKADGDETVQAMVADYLDHLAAGGAAAHGKPVAESTLAMYHQYARHINAVFGLMRPEHVTTQDVSLYLYRCERTSARQEISLLSGAYGRAVIMQRATSNPCHGARSHKPRAKRDRVPMLDELRAVYAHGDPRLRVAMDIATMTSIRISDLVRLRFDQFQPDGVIEHQKNKARQRFTLTPELVAVLDEARAIQGRVRSLYVVTKPDGQPYSRDGLAAKFREAAARAGVVGLVWHDMRAFAALQAERDGRSPQRLLGHADERTTRVYLRGKRVIEVEPLRRKLM